MPTTTKLTIQRWGNSLAVRIPADVVRAARLEEGQEMVVTVEESGMTLKPLGPRKATLAEKLEKFNPAKHGGEAITTGLIGAECNLPAAAIAPSL